MIRVTIELISPKWGGDTDKIVGVSRRVIGVMDIVNDGAHEQHERGNYGGFLYRRGAKLHGSIPDLINAGKVIRQARVDDWPRQSKSVWLLVRRMLNKMYD